MRSSIRPKTPKAIARKTADAAYSVGVIQGMALALAEMYRHGSDGASERTVARDAGITIAVARRAGVDPYDLKALRQAGIK